MFAKLEIHQWRQFDHVEIDFHPRLTILTGANGSGKTTLLHLLNRHWGWNLGYVSSPSSDSRTEDAYRSGFWGESESKTPSSKARGGDFTVIGTIDYADSTSAKVQIPSAVKERFDITLNPKHRVKGVYVPSHRPPYSYQRIDAIPVRLDAKEQIFQNYLSEVMRAPPSIGSPLATLKKSLICLAMFGYGNRAVEGNSEAVEIFEGFQVILRTMLPKSLGFNSLRIRSADVALSTSTGDFAIDAVSGGIATIIDIVWQIYMYSLIHKSEGFVVVIDEPEAHLHPGLQQTLLPNLLKTFPLTQFVIATHNPFMVTSVKDSNVYVLQYNSEGKVDSELLEVFNRSGTADETLMDVLGVPYTLPQWASARIERILDEFAKTPLTSESMAALKAQMTDLGMQHLFPETLAKVAEGQR
jgi:hypothetical protein